MTEVTPSSRVIVVTLGTFQILAWGSSFYLLGVLGHPIAADTGWPLAAVLGGVSLAMLVAGVASPKIGALIHARGRRHVLAFSAAMFCAGLLLLAATPTLVVYLAAWALIGLGMASGLYDPAFATLGRIYGPSAKSMITTVTLFGGFASTVCWPIAAYLLEKFGWRWTCVAFATAHLVLALPAYLLLVPESNNLPKETRASHSEGLLRQSKHAAALWIVGVILTASAAVLSMVSTHLLTLLQIRGISLAEAVAFGALIGPAQVGARFVELTIGRHYHPLWTLLAGVALVLVGALLLWTDYPLIGVALVLYGAGNGIISVTRGSVPLMLFGATRLPKVLGRLALPSLLGMAAAPTLGAILIEQGGAPLVFKALVVLCAGNVVLATLLIVGFRR